MKNTYPLATVDSFDVNPLFKGSNSIKSDPMYRDQYSKATDRPWDSHWCRVLSDNVPYQVFNDIGDSSLERTQNRNHFIVI